MTAASTGGAAARLTRWCSRRRQRPRALRRRALDGAIVIDPVAGDPIVRRTLRARAAGRHHRPGCWAPTERACWVDNDHVAGTREMLDHLARRGSRRIALLANPTTMSYTVDVEDAYRAWCREHRAPPVVTKVGADLTESAGYNTTTQLLGRATPPDAIYATYDRLGVGALLAARAASVEVPGDLLVAVTATESSTAHPAKPPLTSLDLNPDQIGERAAELLIELIEGRRPPERHVIVPTRLIARTSTRRRHRASVRRSESSLMVWRVAGRVHGASSPPPERKEISGTLH